MLVSTSGSKGFIDNNVNSGGYAVLFTNNSVGMYDKNGSILSPAGLLTVNNWIAICVTKTGSTLRIYIDGNLVATGSSGSIAPAFTHVPLFGQLYFNSIGNYASLNGKWMK